ncbi:MAG: hypothetical protein JWN70_5633 [Planctomycetaceae bacterium]|nr:hypothetical protein [Planctomycetaceae bacterium]
MIRKEYAQAGTILSVVGIFVLAVALSSDPEKRSRTGMIAIGVIHMVVAMTWFVRGYFAGKRS